MTKSNSILHRAAALLAALCLLASMALPVYAAETETEFSVSSSETIPGDDNTGNGADGTGSDISVSNLETIQKDGDTTNEGSKTEPEISVPNLETITNSADTTDKAADAPPAEGVTGSENTASADNATAGKTADADNTDEDSTGSEDEATFLNEGDSADDRTITAGNAKESDIALCAGDATVQEGTKYTFYFAPPDSWKDSLSESSTLTCSFKRGNNNSDPDGPKYGVRETTAIRTADSTKDGRPIYQVDVYHNNDDKDSLCPYGGFVWVKFALDNDHWVQMNGERKNNECWMFVKDIADKCLDGNKLNANAASDYDLSKWVPYADIIPKHVRYCGQEMVLLNNSSETLDSVTATFWEKDDNGDFKQVGNSQPTGVLQTNGQAVIKIPTDACAYVSFQKSDNTYIGKHYFNFYNDEAETKEIAVFPYDPVTRYCLIYKGDDDVRWSAPGSKTVYFDATFSDMSYKGDAATTYGMPDANGNLWCYITSDDSSKPAITSQMARDGTSEIWYADVPQGYTQIRFASWEVGGTNTANNGTDTVLLTIPDLSKPCFYADTSDDVIYQGGNRGGYWDELGAVRDVEKGKKGENGETKSIVDLESKTFKPQSNTKYISTTLYDYYTDYELNGNNRNTYSSNEVNTQRGYVTFEQFDRALSNYYKQYADINKKPINYPLYTGHFQPNNWGSAFSGIASNLNLYGWSTTEDDTYWRFIAVNNSAYALDDNHSGEHYKDTFQGLVGNQMKDGMPVMAGTDLAEPHFNEAFLTGTNAEKAVLGKVYKDVSFPFTQKPVFTQNEGDSESKAQYWYFDSNERSLYLKQDNANSKYYLEATKTGTSENPIYTDLNSQNRGSDNSTEDNKNNNQSRGYGFFPFNQKIMEENRNVNKYNYGFGAKLQFDFTLTDDGQVVVGTDEKGKDIKVPIKFFFSGDDDVWVYIDGQLVLDVGGAHGKASGLLEFGDNGTDNTVTPYVSSNKEGGNVYKDDAENKFVYFNGSKVTFDKKGKILDKDDKDKEFTLDKGTTHTLTMFYMERGMWESNMAVAFNFPDHNELQVEKKVDLRGVDEDFQACFSDQKIFDFTIQNLATHYGAKPAAQPGTGNVDKKVVDLTADVTSIGPATTDSPDYIFALAPDPVQTNTGKVLHWFAPYNDLNSAYRDKRYGILQLKDSIDLRQYGYLTFQIYVEGTTNLSLSNLYLELLDENDKQMGSLGKAGLNGATFGSATLVPNKWNTVKLSLNKMNAVAGFGDNVKTIRVGDNYERHIYFKDITFVPKTVPDIKTGFTTEQDKIPDYGSAESGALQNAKYAKYTSSVDGVQVVDDQGLFVLENGETITFNDQFRRGSYISLKEILDPDLYETKWTVYENGLPVTSMKGDNVSTVKVENQNKSLEKQTATVEQPNDGRTENKGTDAEQKDNEYDGNKPSNANTIVFRSYSNPDESGDSLTRLKVQYINKVKTGGLIIKKEAAAGEPLTGTYTFKVTFSDVGGQGLEPGDPIVKKYTINMGDTNADHTVPITGIPVGTRYTIKEVGTSDGSHLQGITLVGNEKNAHVVNNTTVEGVIVESTAPQIMTATFTNTKRTLIDIAFTKLWKDAADNALGSEKLPDKIYIQLQRRLENSTDWDAVAYPATGSTGSANYVIVTPTNGGWQCSFTGLDQHKLNGNTNYVYRIVEGTVDTNDNFKAAGSSITIGGNTYTISAAANLTGKAASGTSETITGGSGEIVLTNTLQDPKFTLNIVKKGVTTGENGTEVQTPLGGVEFKLERLAVPSGGGEPQVDDTYDFGNGKIGSITGTTGDDGQITDNPFKNLKPGSYQLTEVKTAEGYNLLSKPIRIEFNTKGECYIDGVKDSAHVTQAGNTYTMTLTVLNRKSFELPHTGADAPSLWLLIGLPALVAVLLVLVFRYNKKGGRRQ